LEEPERHECLLRLLGEPVCRHLGIYRVPDDFLLSVVIPVYNERDTIREILRRVQAVPIPKQVILVDDCSTDGTREVLRALAAEQPALTVLFHEANRGKGAALRSGFGHAVGAVVIVQDADLEYDPAHAPELIAPIRRGEADVVYGSRLAGTDVERVWKTRNRLGNRALSMLTQVLYQRRLTDMETGHKAFRREILQAMDLREDDFAIEPEMTAHVLRRRLRLVEVPISYHGRTHADGKEIRWRDGAKAVRVLLTNRMRRLH
jgi:glycosyltransferase involved in cell wall biosynthesis